MNPRSRTIRILKPMSRFHADFKHGLPAYASQIPVAHGEEIIGIYENVAGTISQCIAMTNLRLLIESGGQWKSIVYSQIVAIETPEPAAVEEIAAALTVRLMTGALETVPINGRHGRFLDLFEFSRFLARVREDAERGTPGNEVEQAD